MNTIIRSVGQVTEKAFMAQPVVFRALQLMFALAAYAAGIYLVDLATTDARIPVILFAVYFLPAVLRAWLQLYWQLRGDVRAVKPERHLA